MPSRPLVISFFLTKIQPELPPQVITLMDTAEGQLRRLGEITRKTLGFFKDQTETKDFDLIDIAESALTLHAQRTGRQNIELCKRFKSPPSAKSSRGEILHILSNLILNALDVLPAREGVLCVRAKTSGDNVVVTVSDNGTGIEKAIFEKLFEGRRSTKTNGTGLGLWVSNNFVLKHGGVLACRTSTRPGHSGTTFRLTIPCRQVLKAAQN